MGGKEGGYEGTIPKKGRVIQRARARGMTTARGRGKMTKMVKARAKTKKGRERTEKGRAREKRTKRMRARVKGKGMSLKRTPKRVKGRGRETPSYPGDPQTTPPSGRKP